MDNRLKELRESRGLTLEELAIKANTSKGQIWKLENGQRQMTAKWMKILGGILNYQPHELLYADKALRENSVTGFEQMPSSFNANKAPIYGYAAGAGNVNVLNEGMILGYKERLFPAMGKDGFYLSVVGDSMEPLFEQGSLVAVSRIIPPKKGKPCVIELLDGTAAVKIFLRTDGTEIVCKQLNPECEINYYKDTVKNIYCVVGLEF